MTSAHADLTIAEMIVLAAILAFVIFVGRSDGGPPGPGLGGAAS
jgi:hypothetical protein